MKNVFLLLILLASPVLAQRSVTVRNPRGENLRTDARQSGDWVTDVSKSTVGIRGSTGETITSEAVGSDEALHVINLGKPNLAGLSMVYVSSDSVTVGESVSFTGLGKEIILQAISNECTYKINGGDDIIIRKNTAEDFDLAYTLTNPSVSLESKGGGANCKIRITGVN